MVVMAVWRAFAKPFRYAALAAGALPALAFPELNLEFLGWCGLVPAILIIRGRPVRPGGRGARLVAGRRLHPGLPVLADPEHRPGAAARRGGVRGVVDGLRGGGLGPAAPAAPPGPRARGARRAARLLGVHRVGPVLAGVRRPLGRAGRQPVAASRGAGPGRGGWCLADQLRPGRGEHGYHDPAAGPGHGGARRGGRRGRRGAGRGTGGLRPHRGRAAGPARDRGPGAAGYHPQQASAGGCEPAAVRTARCWPARHHPARHHPARHRPPRPDRLG